MRIAIIGSGALACLFGAHLAPHTAVTLVGSWSEQLAALRRGPLRLLRLDGSPAETALSITDNPAAAGPAAVVLVLTKAGRTAQAAAAAAEALAPDGVTVTLQNGLGPADILAQALGAAHVAPGVTMQGASMEGPGLVRHGGAGPTYLAQRPQHSAQLAWLADLLNRSGLESHLRDDIDGLVWGKLAVNAAINPLTALLAVPNGALLHSGEARELLRAAAREVQAVAVAAGITLPYPDAGLAAEEAAAKTAANRSSMLQDLARGAATEIEAISGAVVGRGLALGLPTPVNMLLYRLVKAREQLAQNL